MECTDNKKKVRALIEKGVGITCPESVEIGPEVDISRISGDGVRLSPGTRIHGEKTLILKDAVIGEETPATVNNCQVGPAVRLKGGFFSDAVFLHKSSAGSGSHVRGGTILEEEASIAHTVGLKQTILFPFVTLGSLINFCDIFMSGGTSRKNHSEVGSSFIHFNYTPNQDKATPSLLGNGPAGVMLDKPPIFLGGQGGLVGPCRFAFGTVSAAGTIYRKDELRPGRLIFDGGGKRGSVPASFGVYKGVKRIVDQNLNYIGNLAALKNWYLYVRKEFAGENFTPLLLEGLIEKTDMAIAERIKRFMSFCDKLPLSIELYLKNSPDSDGSVLIRQKRELTGNRDTLEAVIKENVMSEGDSGIRDAFLETVTKSVHSSGPDYINVIQNLDVKSRDKGVLWLQGIVDGFVANTLKIIPLFE